jgi:hypothetical protein
MLTFRLGGDVLEPYKTIIGRWLRPDVYKHQEYSVSKAKRPITDYKKAAGLPYGILTFDLASKVMATANPAAMLSNCLHPTLIVLGPGGL